MTDSLNLFSISQEIRDIQHELIENGGELTPELENKLLISEEQLSTKLTGYKHVILEMDSIENVAKEEISRLKQLIERKNNVSNRLKFAMLQAILEFGNEKNGVFSIELGINRFSTRISSRLIINEEELDENEYSYDVKFADITLEQKNSIMNILDGNIDIVPIITKKINKVALKKELKKRNIEGVKLEKTYNLNIK